MLWGFLRLNNMTQTLIDKTCFNCKISKPLCCFYDKKNSKDGKENQCQDCRRNKMRFIRQHRDIVITPASKTCPKCKNEKSFLEFYRSKKQYDGLSAYCKQCSSFIDNLRNATTSRRDFKKNFQQLKRAVNKEVWQKFFQEKYGDPICSICKCLLSWNYEEKYKKINDRTSLVIFDHRCGGYEKIKGSPSHWYTDHICNSLNKEIWMSCNFGILCAKCNTGLPTLNREGWLVNVIGYIGVKS